MHKAIILFLVCYCSSLISQVPEWAWIKSVRGSNQLVDIATDKQGNIYAVGTYNDQLQSDNEVFFPAFRKYIIGIFLVKYSSNGAQQWIKTVKADYSIGDVKLCINTADNPEIIFFSYGDTVDYMDTVLYDHPIDSILHTYTNYLNIIEYQAYSGKLLKMKQFETEGNIYKFIRFFNIDNFGNYYISGFTGFTRFGSYIASYEMTVKLDPNYNLLWDYPFIETRDLTLDGTQQSYSTTDCYPECFFHDVHINSANGNSFISKYNNINGIIDRIHSVKGHPYCRFSSVSFHGDNKLTTVVNNSTNIILDDSLQIDSTIYPNLNFFKQSALLAEFDASDHLLKKCLLVGSYNYSRYLLKNEHTANYFSLLHPWNNIPAAFQINNDSVIVDASKLIILVLDSNFNYLSSRFLSSRNIDLHSSSFTLPVNPYDYRRMIKDNNNNIIVHFDFMDSVITDNGLLLVPFVRSRYSSFIAKLGNNVSGIPSINSCYHTLIIYPNPAMHQLNIEIPEGKTLQQMIISTSFGQVVKNIDVNTVSKNTSIDIHQLDAGSYFLVGIDNKGEKYVARFIKLGM